MIEARTLAVAALWIAASTLALPVQADEAAQSAPEEPSLGEARPQTEDSDEAAIDGQKLFAGVCGFCHADGGRKASKGPKLAGSERSDEFIIERIKHGKSGRMPAFGGAFSGQQIEQILVYIRSLEP